MIVYIILFLIISGLIIYSIWNYKTVWYRAIKSEEYEIKNLEKKLKRGFTHITKTVYGRCDCSGSHYSCAIYKKIGIENIPIEKLIQECKWNIEDYKENIK